MSNPLLTAVTTSLEPTPSRPPFTPSAPTAQASSYRNIAAPQRARTIPAASKGSDRGLVRYVHRCRPPLDVFTIGLRHLRNRETQQARAAFAHATEGDPTMCDAWLGRMAAGEQTVEVTAGAYNNRGNLGAALRHAQVWVGQLGVEITLTPGHHRLAAATGRGFGSWQSRRCLLSDRRDFHQPRPSGGTMKFPRVTARRSQYGGIESLCRCTHREENLEFQPGRPRRVWWP
ncbi:hypothetical protein [Mycobacterium szulgai]|uniref:hypothetical protein n=1 Tax=Mycobacterium szulgai TaxID=1787 RepID=UPI0026BB09F1